MPWIDQSHVGRVTGNPDHATVVRAVLRIGISRTLCVSAYRLLWTTRLAFLGCILNNYFYLHIDCRTGLKEVWQAPRYRPERARLPPSKW
jgi:hypothetical protein